MRATLLTISLFLSVTNTIAQFGIEWQRCSGGSQTEESYSVKETVDGGFVIAGSAVSVDGDVSGGNGVADAWIVKLNSLGALVWEKTYGGSNSDRAYDIEQTNDGGFIVAATSISNNGDVSGNIGVYDFWILKLDVLGNLEWERSFGGSADEEPRRIKPTQDGGYIIVGYTESSNGDVTVSYGSKDAWVIKIDSVGNLMWEKSLGTAATEGATGVVQNPDGSFVVLSNVNMDFTFHKIDGFGNVIWEEYYGGSSYEFTSELIKTEDNGFLAVGTCGSNNGDVTSYYGDEDCWVVKTNSGGQLEWQKTLGGSAQDFGKSVTQLADGHYIIGATTTSSDWDVSLNHGWFDFWVVKLSSTNSGSIIWEKTFGGSHYDYAHALVKTSDGAIVYTGTTYSNDGDVSGIHTGSQFQERDIWTLKISSVSKTDELTRSDLLVKPNPAENHITVVFSNSVEADFFSIINIIGESVQSGCIDSINKTIDISTLSSGSYYLVFSNKIKPIRFVKK